MVAWTRVVAVKVGSVVVRINSEGKPIFADGLDGRMGAESWVTSRFLESWTNGSIIY